MLSQVLKSAESHNVSIVSTDVFDTLFLRSATSERRRFRGIARSIATRLTKEGYAIDAETILYTRLEVQTAAYRAVETRQSPGDVRLRDMVAVLVRLLRLPTDMIDLIVETEVEADLATLKANHRLVSALNQLRDKGKTVIAVSDTYYSAAQLAFMISRLVADNPVSRVYASSDQGATKKSGRLYQIVAAAEKCPTCRILHLGDDRGVDYRMAAHEGVISLHTPRSREVWARRKVDAALQKVLRPPPARWRFA